MRGTELEEQMRALLDPVLVAAGFLAGQGGPESMIFCAAHDGFSDRFPLLPQANAQERGLGCCIDLMVEVDVPAGRFTRVDLETFSLVARCDLWKFLVTW